jgi:hypothetical protein
MEQEIPEQAVENRGLWLTDQLLSQLHKCAKLGKPIMVLGLLLCISTLLNSLFVLIGYWSQKALPATKFYLLEGENLYRVLSLVINIALFYTCLRGTFEGYQAWRLLRFSETDDDALLEGSERLGKMFRWLVIWAGIFGARILFGLLSQQWMS